MTGDARQFAMEMKADLADEMGRVNQAVRYIALEGLKRVVQKSPVGNPALWKHPVAGYVGGRFRGNWALSIGAVDTRETDTVDKSGGATIAKGNSVLAGYAGRDDFPAIYIQNNLPYAERLEDGWSSQAPGGMVGLTVAELAALWNSLKL